MLVIEELWERYGIGKAIREVIGTKQVPYDKALLSMVANRLCTTESKLGVWDRWLETVYMPECSDFKLRQMYEAMDVLHQHASHIEEQVFFQVANICAAGISVVPAERQARHRQENVAMLEEELQQHKDKSATRKWAIGLLASRRYKKYLAITDKGTIRIDRAAIRDAAKYDGKWVLETNDETISLEDAAHGYRGLMAIERCFRSLKRAQIRMMPMYHWLPHRIESHVKICVLALLIERVAEINCGKPSGSMQNTGNRVHYVLACFFSIK